MGEQHKTIFKPAVYELSGVDGFDPSWLLVGRSFLCCWEHLVDMDRYSSDGPFGAMAGVIASHACNHGDGGDWLFVSRTSHVERFSYVVVLVCPRQEPLYGLGVI